jgi:hypothetical protein
MLTLITKRHVIHEGQSSLGVSQMPEVQIVGQTCYWCGEWIRGLQFSSVKGGHDVPEWRSNRIASTTSGTWCLKTAMLDQQLSFQQRARTGVRRAYSYWLHQNSE